MLQCIAPFAGLLDHFVGGGEQLPQEIDAEAPRCRQIDDEFESGCARHRQIGRFRSCTSEVRNYRARFFLRIGFYSSAFSRHAIAERVGDLGMGDWLAHCENALQ